MIPAATTFVKSASTKVPVEDTQGHIISMLHRYGASGFGFRRQGDVITVTFHIPAEGGGPDRTVAIPIDIGVVRKKLNPHLDELAAQKHGTRTGKDPGRAERVAWRIVLDWIDASLSAVSVGAQTLETAFYAHTVIETADGQRGRLIDYVETIKGAAGDAQGRLPKPGVTLQLGPGGAL